MARQIQKAPNEQIQVTPKPELVGGFNPFEKN